MEKAGTAPFSIALELERQLVHVPFDVRLADLFLSGRRRGFWPPPGRGPGRWWSGPDDAEGVGRFIRRALRIELRVSSVTWMPLFMAIPMWPPIM